MKITHMDRKNERKICRNTLRFSKLCSWSTFFIQFIAYFWDSRTLQRGHCHFEQSFRSERIMEDFFIYYLFRTDWDLQVSQIMWIINSKMNSLWVIFFISNLITFASYIWTFISLSLRVVYFAHLFYKIKQITWFVFLYCH